MSTPQLDKTYDPKAVEALFTSSSQFGTERGHSCPQQRPNTPELAKNPRAFPHVHDLEASSLIAADRNVRAPDAGPAHNDNCCAALAGID